LQIDERERLSNLDIYGHEAFFSGGFDVTLNAGTLFNVSAGVAYVGGVRCEFAATQVFDVGALPNSIWLDASLQGDLTGKEAIVILVADAGTLIDYIDGNGVEHYVAKICDITGGSAITDTKVITNLVDDHEGKSDPHTQYLRKDDVVTQAAAEAGISTIVRAWTAQRVKQAIVTLASVAGATETVAGKAEIATQDETEAGSDDTRIVTPKKLRWGFSSLFADNGYIVFPDWLGGFIIQWIKYSVANSNTLYTLSLPIPFVNNFIFTSASHHQTGANAYLATTAVVSLSQVNLRVTTSSPGSFGCFIIALGN